MAYAFRFENDCLFNGFLNSATQNVYLLNRFLAGWSIIVYLNRQN